jgi:hypothetical protein
VKRRNSGAHGRHPQEYEKYIRALTRRKDGTIRRKEKAPTNYQGEDL